MKASPFRVRSLRRMAATWIAVFIGTCGSIAQTTIPQQDARGDDEIRIREVFSSHLPNTMAKSSFRASIHPHFGDFDRHDYFRVSNTLRYGLTSRLEISAGADTYFSHGLGKVALFKDVGFMAALFGAKLNIGDHILKGWDSSVGFDEVVPVGTPPPELTDGLRHFSPYVTFSRRLESRRDVRLFWGAGVDLVTSTRFAGEHKRNDFTDDSMHFSAGFVIDRNMLHYSLETQVATSRFIGDGSDDDVFTVRPGVIWEIPKWHDRHTRSGWLIGLAGKASFGPDGTVFGLSAKLRLNIDVKKLLGREKKSGE